MIPEDKPVTGGFMDLDQDIEKLMLATTDKWLAGQDVPEDPILQNFVRNTTVWWQILTDGNEQELPCNAACGRI